jgi:hypothetical protein
VGGRSGRQGCHPAGGSPAVSIARSGHGAMPPVGAGNHPSAAWGRRPGRPEGRDPAAVGAPWGSSAYGSLHITHGLQPRNVPAVAVALRRCWARRPWARCGEAGVGREATSRRTARALRGRGPSTSTRIAARTSGTTSCQPGRAAPCTDWAPERAARGSRGARSGACARRSDAGGGTPTGAQGLSVMVPDRDHTREAPGGGAPWRAAWEATHVGERRRCASTSAARGMGRHPG